MMNMTGCIGPLLMLEGLLAGFVAAAPTGPSGVLVIERTLDKGRRYGFFTGLGISFSDAVYIVCSSIGLTFLMDLVNDRRTYVICSIVGCCLLMAFGIFTVRNNPLKKLRTPKADKPSLAYASLSGFLVAIVNPMVIVIYITLFAYFHMDIGGMEPWQMSQCYLAVYAGDLLWWVFISFLIDKLRNRFDLKGIWVINRIFGSVLIVAAVTWLIILMAH